MEMGGFIVDWRSLNYPVDLESIFGRNSETELEVGFGNGVFLLQIAKDNPDKTSLELSL